MIDKLMIVVEAQVKQAVAGMDRVKESIRNAHLALNIFNRGINNSVQGFQMQMMTLENLFLGLGLSLLFTGMAVKNFFQSILQSLFQIFLSAEGETGAMNNAVAELYATVLAFGHSLVQAFVDSGAAQEWIDRITKLTDWFNALDDTAKSNIVNFMMWGVVVAAAAMVIGQIALGLLAVTALMKYFSKVTIFLWRVALTVFRWIGNIVMWLAKNPLALLILAFIALGTFIYKTVQLFGGFGNFFKSVLMGIAKSVINSVNLWVDFWIDRLQDILNIAHKVAVAMGWDGMAERISGASEGLISLKRKKDDLVMAALNKVDELGGGKDIRDTISINIEGSVIAEQDLLDKIVSALGQSAIAKGGSSLQ